MTRMINRLMPGDVLFGWNIAYDDPQAIWSKNALTTGEIFKMGRETPVLDEPFWESWVVIRTDSADLIILAPILWHDLGHYRHLRKLDAVESCPIEIELAPGTLRASILLGKTIIRTADDLAGRPPALQRRLPRWASKALSSLVAAAARGVLPDCGRIEPSGTDGYILKPRAKQQ